MAAAALEAEQQATLINSALIGWQLAGSFGGKTGKFKEYAQRLGVLPHSGTRVVTPEQELAAQLEAEGLHAQIIQSLQA